VLVDYPGIQPEVGQKSLRSSGFTGKILYDISPQVWAWNRGRIARLAEILDLMICVFPFEAPMYEASGLHTVFVGHPLLEALGKERIEMPREPGLGGIVSGSREREVKRIFPVMAQAAQIIQKSIPSVRFEAAAANDTLAERMREMAPGVTVRTGTAHDLMQRASAGIVCSGTATLEAAYYGLPYCLVLQDRVAHFLKSGDGSSMWTPSAS